MGNKWTLSEHNKDLGVISEIQVTFTLYLRPLISSSEPQDICQRCGLLVNQQNHVVMMMYHMEKRQSKAGATDGHRGFWKELPPLSKNVFLAKRVFISHSSLESGTWKYEHDLEDGLWFEQKIWIRSRLRCSVEMNLASFWLPVISFTRITFAHFSFGPSWSLSDSLWLLLQNETS